MIVSAFLDPDDLRFTQDHLIAANRGKRLAHGVLGGRIGNQDHRHRLARAAGDIAAMRRLAAVTLHDRLERDVLLRQSLGDGRGGARFVYRKEADVVTALIGAFLLVVSRAEGRPNGAVSTPRAMSPISATTADAVAGPPAPGQSALQRDLRAAVSTLR